MKKINLFSQFIRKIKLALASQSSREIKFDHIAIPAVDSKKSAEFLAAVLEVKVLTVGEMNDPFYCVGFDNSLIMFTQVHQKFDPIHCALRVTEKKFSRILEILSRQKIPYGNNHENPTNFETSDFLGGRGRIYFYLPDHHLFEICC